MKVLVLCSNYPNLSGKTEGMFFHVRNLYYKENGIQVDVINFSTYEKYNIEGIDVYSYEGYQSNLISNKYDILICHAPHINHHYKFLKKHSGLFHNIVFIYHGNEVFKTKRILPKEYTFVKSNSLLSKIKRNLKDEIKLFLWRHLLIDLSHKSDFIFVSKWMREQFFYFTKINKSILENRNHIIYNSIGKPFEINKYDKNSPKKYDFITIRNNFDSAKYGIDIVNNLAKINKNYKFLVIGKGDFFNYYDKADNIDLIQKELSHNDILHYLNKSKCGLLPTLWDSQGLMTCELATFGIPTITSDIPICHEILDEFENIGFIDNENAACNLSTVFNRLTDDNINYKNETYYAANTSGKEIELFDSIIA